MATTLIPPPVGYGTVIGSFLDHAGRPIKGQVIFTPSPAWVKNSTLPALFLPRTVVVTLGVDGELPPTELVATDNPDDNPTGDWTYTVSFKLDCVGLHSFSFELPAGTTVDLNTVIPVAQSGGTPIIQGPPGPPGVVQSIVAGTNVTVDDTDPANPIVSATGGGGGGAVDSVNGQTGAVVLDAGDVGAATAAQGATADTAVQPGDLGTAAYEDTTAFATTAQGDLADTAVQPAGLADYAKTDDLGSAAFEASTAFATSAQGDLADTAVQPGALGTAAYEASTAFATAAQGGKADTAVQGVVAGTNVTVDNADPLHPVVSASGGGGGGAVDSVNGQTGVVVLDADDVGAATPADLAGKQDLVAAPTSGHFAGLDGSGQVVDSGSSPTDFATAAQGGLADTAVQPAALNDYTKTDDLGSAAFEDAAAFATSAQGSLADTAVQPGALSTVATSGAYSDLTGKPTIPSTPADIGAATAAQGSLADTAVQPGSLGSAAYEDTTDFATAAQGGLADTAVQPAALNDYAKTDDLGSAAFEDTTDFATAAQGALADTSLQPGFDLAVAAATETLGRVQIDDDGSSTSGWPDRLAIVFNPATGTAHLVTWFNEYGEYRGTPGKSNTVGWRLFTKPGSADPVHTGDVWQISDDRDNRNTLVGIDGSGNVTAVGNVTAANIGAKTIVSDTAPSDTSAVWVDTSGL